MSSRQPRDDVLPTGSALGLAVRPAPAGPPVRTEVDTYASTVQMAHTLTSFADLPDRVPADGLLYHAEEDGSPVVLAVRNDRLPDAYRQGLYGFRLAQCLRLRFADARIAYERRLITEPHQPDRPEIHLMALDPASGRILRYLSLLGSPDRPARRALDPQRSLFPCEVAHGVNLFEHIEFGRSVDTSRIWELKRLVQSPENERAGAKERLRLTLALMLGFYTTLERLQPAAKVLVGDGEEGIAMQRLLRSLREITVIEGTTPSLPPDNLMFPLYTQREVVKPFLALAPRGPELAGLIDTLRCALDAVDPLAGFRELSSRVAGTVRRVQI